MENRKTNETRMEKARGTREERRKRKRKEKNLEHQQWKKR